MKYLAFISALCFLFLFSEETFSQNRMVDSLIHWISTHPAVDSQYIQTLHRISYRLSEQDPKKSFEYYEKVSFLSDSLHFTFGKSLAQINLGILLSNSGNFEASNNAYFKAINQAEVCGALRLKAVSLNNIGDNFKILKDYERCREYSNEALPINMLLKAWRGVAINYELLFQCDFEEKKYSEAKDMLQQGMPFAKQANESYIFSQYHLDYGKWFAANNDKDSAAFYFTKAITESGIQSDRKNEAIACIAEAQYLSNLSVAGKLAVLRHALSVSKQIHYLEGAANAAQQLSLVYDELKNKDSSLLFYNAYRSASDSLFSENNKRNVIIKESEWLLRRKEIENQHLKELAQLQSKEIRAKSGLLLITIICFALAIIIAIFIYKSIQSKKQSKEFILKQKISETEMQVLRAQMNPHFIFNCLSSINSFILKNETEAASDYLTKFSRLIRMVLNNSQRQEISLEDELEMLKLYLYMERLRFKNNFTYHIHISENIEPDSIFIPPLLLQPFAENAIWHGLMHKQENGLLKIEIEKEDNMLVCVISDNGIGREAAIALHSKSAIKEKSMGMHITKERLSHLNGHLSEKTYFEINDLKDRGGNASGTSVRLKIKFSDTLREPTLQNLSNQKT